MAQQQRKPVPEAAPPPRWTTIPPPANDNRARRLALWVGGVFLAVALLLLGLYGVFG